jgi:hypothetical protein
MAHANPIHANQVQLKLGLRGTPCWTSGEEVEQHAAKKAKSMSNGVLCGKAIICCLRRIEIVNSSAHMAILSNEMWLLFY